VPIAPEKTVNGITFVAMVLTLCAPGDVGEVPKALAD